MFNNLSSMFGKGKKNNLNSIDRGINNILSDKASKNAVPAPSPSYRVQTASNYNQMLRPIPQPTRIPQQVIPKQIPQQKPLPWKQTPSYSTGSYMGGSGGGAASRQQTPRTLPQGETQYTISNFIPSNKTTNYTIPLPKTPTITLAKGPTSPGQPQPITAYQRVIGAVPSSYSSPTQHQMMDRVIASKNFTYPNNQQSNALFRAQDNIVSGMKAVDAGVMNVTGNIVSGARNLGSDIYRGIVYPSPNIANRGIGAIEGALRNSPPPAFEQGIQRIRDLVPRPVNTSSMMDKMYGNNDTNSKT